MIEVLYETLEDHERDFLQKWLREREWVSSKNTWILGMRRDEHSYTQQIAIQVGLMLKKEFGWVKTGRRANIDGERHWLYVPKGSKKYPAKAALLHASEVFIDEKEIAKWSPKRTYTTTVEVLHRVFRVSIPKTVDTITQEAMDEVRTILVKQGWTLNARSSNPGHDVFYRENAPDPSADFDNILG